MLGRLPVFSCSVHSHLQVIDAINALSEGKPSSTATAAAGAVITDCGQVRQGEPQLTWTRCEDSR